MLNRVMSWMVLSVSMTATACGGASPTAVDATTPACEEGAMRADTCGNCGMVSELCQSGAWVPQGACLGEGDCTPGATENGTLPLCGEEQRLCDNSCAWGQWTVTMPGTGDCEPGDERTDQADCSLGLYRRQICSNTCAWVTQSDPCVDLCGDVPRTTVFTDEQEVCIPAGDFRRGLMGYANSEPVQTVSVSAFYIDRYVVTNRRYKGCVDAGLCGLPSRTDALEVYNDPSHGDHPVWNITWDDAVAFCDWDGGRRLLTEAEWEKAARGPAPRENRFTWDDPTMRCDLLLVVGCPGYISPTSPLWTDPVTAIPGDFSYYGVYGMLGGIHQWTHDWYNPFYYADPSSLVDPQGPLVGSDRVIRGFMRNNLGLAAMGAENITTRQVLSPGGDSDFSGIRCGRDPAGT